ncbi:dihydrodipicolinate synthase family protein [Streptomyces shenzhenensis]
MSSLVLSGILPALTTPFTADAEAVDEAALQALVQRLVSAGVGGLIPCGSTGQYGALTADERRRVTELVVDAAAGAVPVVPHVGASTTAAAVALAEHAKSAGASAVMATPPAGVGWDGVLAHYRAIAGATDLPVMLYHIPEATGQIFSAEQVAELAQIDNVRYMKDSSGDFALVTELIQRPPHGLEVFNGSDSLTFAGLAAGAGASVWGMANFIPNQAVALHRAIAVDKDLEKAREIWSKIWPVCRLVDTHDDYVSAVKAACEVVGIQVGPSRRPAIAPDAAFMAELRETLAIAAS